MKKWKIYGLCLGIPLFTHAQQDSAKHAKQVEVAVIPSVGYSPETRWYFGGNATTLFKLHKNDTLTRTSNASFDVLYTQNRQAYIGLEYNLFFKKEEYMLRGINEWIDFNLDYFGIGPQSPNTPETFDFRQLTLDNTVFKKLNGKTFIGIGYRYSLWQTLRTQPGGLLEFDNPAHYKQSVSSGAMFTYLVDSRDNIVNTFKGGLFNFSLTLNNKWLGSTANNPNINIEASKFYNVNRFNHILAFHALGNFNFGEVPFAEYSVLGSENMKRGYYSGRYRDKQFAAMQAEYRFPIYKRLGMVVFGAMGDVASSMQTFTVQTIKFSGGAGLRYMLFKDERLNLRLDYGITNQSGFIYIGIGEAF